MTAHAIPADDIVFAARLSPHRSLGRQGFLVLMIAVGTICFTVGMVFAIAGVWPVLGFMGLDVLAIWWAFRMSYRSGKAYEDVEVSRRHVLLRKVAPNGRARDHSFPQFGTRFEVDRHEEIGITRMRLANRAREVEFGYLLNPNDRESFAEAFARAMSRAKR